MSKVQTIRSVGLLAGAVLLLAACGGGDDSTAAPVTTEPAAVEESESEQADTAEERFDPCDLVDEALITEVVGEAVTDVLWVSSGGLYEGVPIGSEQCNYEYGDPIERDDNPDVIEALQRVSVGVVVDEAGDPDLAAWEEFSQSVSGSIADETADALDWPPEIEELGDEVATHDDSLVIRDAGTTYRFRYEEDVFSDDPPMEIGEGEVANLVTLATEVLAAGDLVSTTDCVGFSPIAESLYDDVEGIGSSMGGGTRTVDGEQLDYNTRTCRVELSGTSTEAEVTMSEDEEAFVIMSSDSPGFSTVEVVDDLGDGAYLTGGNLFVLDGDRFWIFGDSDFSTITDDQLVELARLVVEN